VEWPLESSELVERAVHPYVSILDTQPSAMCLQSSKLNSADKRVKVVLRWRAGAFCGLAAGLNGLGEATKEVRCRRKATEAEPTAVAARSQSPAPPAILFDGWF
jgi:hypothetical protein